MTLLSDLKELLTERILILDGAMGTGIQDIKVGEAEFKGSHFANFPKLLKGNNEMLNLSQPEKISALHLAFLRAGAEIGLSSSFLRGAQ